MARLAADTHPDVERLLIERYRAMTPAQKLHTIGELTRAADQIAMAGIRRRHPEASSHEIRYALLLSSIPVTSWCVRSDGTRGLLATEMLAEPLRVLARVAEILDGLAIAYAVGGSVASGVHGEPRMTQDVDILVDLPAGRVRAFVESLQPEFYVDLDVARAAQRDHGSFNAIHLVLHHKVDFFVAGGDLLDREQLARRVAIVVDEDMTTPVYVTALENIILRKLTWFRQGNEVSNSQWRDVLGMLKVSGSLLDRVYTEDLARRTGLAALLERAFREAES